MMAVFIDVKHGIDVECIEGSDSFARTTGHATAMRQLV